MGDVITGANGSSSKIDSPQGSALRWYVVQSKPRDEERASHFLREKGFETYLPHMEVLFTKGLRSVLKTKPLFPGYLFCRFDREASLVYVRWTKGVAKILPESSSPLPVEDRLVLAISDLEDKDGLVRKKPLQSQDLIRIARGPMKDILGVFEEWASDRGRVRVLLRFVHYSARVELHHTLIEKVA